MLTTEPQRNLRNNVNMNSYVLHEKNLGWLLPVPELELEAAVELKASWDGQPAAV